MLKSGERAFAIATPKLWNSLPIQIKTPPTLPIFKWKLKHFYLISPTICNVMLHCLCSVCPSVTLCLPDCRLRCLRCWAYGPHMGEAGLILIELQCTRYETFLLMQMTMSAWTLATVVQLPVSTRWEVLSVAVHLASPLTPCPWAVKMWTSVCPPWAPADMAAQTHRVDLCANVLQDITEQDRGEMCSK